MGMHITGVHPIGVYLMGVHLIDVYFVDVYMFPNPKRLWGKPPDLPPYKSTTRLQDGGSGACLIGVSHRRVSHERVSHGRAPHGERFMGMHLIGVHLVGMCLRTRGYASQPDIQVYVYLHLISKYPFCI